MITKNITFAVKILCFIFILTALSCDESLPSRDEVAVETFKILLGTVDGETSYETIPNTGRNPQPIRFSLLLLNIFDETFQGSASSINGTFDIWLADEPKIGKTILLNKNSEFPPIDTPSQIDNDLLTLDPGDTLYMEIHWEHEVEGSVKLWDYFRMANGTERSVGIRALAKVQLFPELPPITTEILKIQIRYIIIG